MAPKKKKATVKKTDTDTSIVNDIKTSIVDEIIYDEKTGEPRPRTAHSLNPVFAYVYEPTGNIKMELSALKDPGISSLAATCLTLLGFEPPEDYTPSIVKIN